MIVTFSSEQRQMVQVKSVEITEELRYMGTIFDKRPEIFLPRQPSRGTSRDSLKALATRIHYATDAPLEMYLPLSDLSLIY